MSWQQSIHEYIDFLKQKYDLSHEEILLELSSQRVPAGIYSGELTPLQATAKYLSEHGETTQSIATQIGRTTRDVENFLSTTGKLGTETGPEISVRHFADRNLSAGEHLVEQLEKHGCTVAEIAKLLDKSEQTVWTQHYRIKAKRGESDE